MGFLRYLRIQDKRYFAELEVYREKLDDKLEMYLYISSIF